MNPAELKAVVEYMESERGVEREVIIRAIELALQSVAEKNGTEDESLRIAIDRKTFERKAFRMLSDGSEIATTPPPLGRIAAQTAKQVIMQKIRNAEKEILFEEYKDRVGEIVTGSVGRFDRDLKVIGSLRPQQRRACEQRRAQTFFFNDLHGRGWSWP